MNQAGRSFADVSQRQHQVLNRPVHNSVFWVSRLTHHTPHGDNHDILASCQCGNIFRIEHVPLRGRKMLVGHRDF